MRNANLKNIYLIALLLIIFECQSFAIKLENFSWMSNFHIGVVSGIGLGIDLGINALFPLGDFKVGPEVEMIMSDVNYSATINASRFGLLFGMDLADNLKAYYHMGTFTFMPTQFFFFTDATGQSYSLSDSTNYKGEYWAISLDYKANDFIFTPKVVINKIKEKGLMNEFDFNIGKSF